MISLIFFFLSFGLNYDPNYNEAYLLKFIDLRKKIEKVLLLMVIIDKKYLSDIPVYMMKKTDMISELSIIFMNCLKMNKLEVFKIIIRFN